MRLREQIGEAALAVLFGAVGASLAIAAFYLLQRLAEQTLGAM